MRAASCCPTRVGRRCLTWRTFPCASRPHCAIRRFFRSKLQRNSIGTIDVTPLEAFTTLTELYLSHNWITAIPDGLFAGMSQLTHLWMQNNRVTSISAGSFQGLDSLVLLCEIFPWLPLLSLSSRA